MNRRGKESLPSLLFLALCFFGGAVLGQVLAARVPDSTGQELTAYLRQFVQLESGETPLWSTLALYFRYPLLAALLGSSFIGVAMLPCTAAAFGLSLSFSVCCFTAAFGPDGVLLALAMFGLRGAVTLPVFFLLAVPSWGAAAALVRASFGRGRWAAPVTYGKDWWRRLAVCGGVLLAGTCVDLLCGPWLLRLALERIF